MRRGRERQGEEEGEEEGERGREREREGREDIALAGCPVSLCFLCQV